MYTILLSGSTIRGLLEKCPTLLFCEILVDFNKAPFHEATLNLHTHDRSVSWWQARSRSEPYQDSKELGEPQEFGFSPKHSESNARNVLEHCRDGGDNCLLATTVISCAAQHHIGMSVVIFGDCLTLFYPMLRTCGVHENLTRALNTTSLKRCLLSTDSTDKQEKIHAYVWSSRSSHASAFH